MGAREDVPRPDPSLPRVPGLVVVDKPLGWTSHDVVARMRRLAGTRKVGHAGTLDPAASGVLVVGVEKATKLLTYVTGSDKTYRAEIRLGAETVTDDAEGEVTLRADPERVAAVTDARILDAVSRLTGDIQQVPSSVSAIKVDGKRSYARVRGGEEVELPARPVTVSEFTVHTIRRGGDGSESVPTGTDHGPLAGEVIDVTATVTCSSGTYIRALARDLGRALGVGGHLTALRRTRVGCFGLEEAHTLDALAEQVRAGGVVDTLEMGDAARRLFPVRELTAEEATDLSHGRRIAAAGAAGATAASPGTSGVQACFAPDGSLVALAENRGRGQQRYTTSVLGITAGTTFGDTGGEDERSVRTAAPDVQEDPGTPRASEGTTPDRTNRGRGRQAAPTDTGTSRGERAHD